MPEDKVVEGRTLYLPLPTLLLLSPGQFGSVVAHELAHFAGEDTEYSLRIAPNYASMSRSLSAFSGDAPDDDKRSPLSTLFVTLPAIFQGVLLIDLFHGAVQRWSRARELEADAAASKLFGPEVVATALLRFCAFAPLLGKALQQIVEEGAESEDLVRDFAKAIREAPAQDAQALLSVETPHPFDSHPPMSARIEALGLKADEALLDQAGARAPEDFEVTLIDAFADAPALSRRLTADVFAKFRQERAMIVSQLRENTQKPVETWEFSEGPTGLLSLLNGHAFAGMMLAAIGFAMLAGLWMRPDHRENWVVISGAVAMFVAGVLYVFYARRPFGDTDEPFFQIAEDSCQFRDLETTLPWNDVEDLSAVENNGLSVAFLLKEEAQFRPAQSSGKRTRYDAEKRTIVMRVKKIQGWKPQAFVEEIGHALRSSRARSALKLFGTDTA
ncbi:M48 family metallopeptidase [Methylocystis heyeri]|uniref:M48 family metalloprotease n=1 Tax=Methylocystis heyeri TaxID=391905 RepID=A0A6B8KDL1_9HYPH|nr:M48 family metalloprotease [Methylocystis heyeri]QGM45692.1 M48 family metalloprotease [Methylocystis heyeri]